jgi:hypothetical protein
VRWQADVAVASGYYPDVKTMAQALFKIMIGRDLGVSTIASMQYIHVIPPREGAKNPAPKIQIGYPVLAELVQRSGKFRYAVDEKTDERAAVSFYQFVNGLERKVGTSVFTIEDAKRAGLVKEYSPWKTYPSTMLFARAMSHGVKTYCPSVLSGADVSEEPYFDGEARLVDDPEPGDVPAEIHEPPGGFPDPWRGFWARARELGLDQSQVHGLFGVPEDDGELKAATERKAEAEGRTLADVIAEMTDRMVAAVGAGDVPA